MNGLGFIVIFWLWVGLGVIRRKGGTVVYSSSGMVSEFEGRINWHRDKSLFSANTYIKLGLLN